MRRINFLSAVFHVIARTFTDKHTHTNILKTIYAADKNVYYDENSRRRTPLADASERASTAASTRRLPCHCDSPECSTAARTEPQVAHYYSSIHDVTASSQPAAAAAMQGAGRVRHVLTPGGGRPVAGPTHVRTRRVRRRRPRPRSISPSVNSCF